MRAVRFEVRGSWASCRRILGAARRKGNGWRTGKPSRTFSDRRNNDGKNRRKTNQRAERSPRKTRPTRVGGGNDVFPARSVGRLTSPSPAQTNKPRRLHRLSRRTVGAAFVEQQAIHIQIQGLCGNAQPQEHFIHVTDAEHGLSAPAAFRIKQGRVEASVHDQPPLENAHTQEGDTSTGGKKSRRTKNVKLLFEQSCDASAKNAPPGLERGPGFRGTGPREGEDYFLRRSHRRMSNIFLRRARWSSLQTRGISLGYPHLARYSSGERPNLAK